MDPNANLREQLQIAAAILAIQDACSDDGAFTEAQITQLADHAQRLAELVEALNGWIAHRGALPAPWSAHWQPIR